MPDYRKRIVDTQLEYRLEEMGAVVIEGPKWCGKTTTAEQKARSIVYLSDPQTRQQYLDMLQVNPGVILRGEAPRLIDEWQIAPQLWDSIRSEIDRRRLTGQFILTGSAVPPETDKIFHSGTGRYAWLTMRTMSLWESGDSTGEISLRNLFDGKTDMSGTNNRTLDDIAYMTCRGGWPASLSLNERASLRVAVNYYDAIVRADVSRTNKLLTSSETLKRILRSYARIQGTQTPATVILDDISPAESSGISINTLHSYLKALRDIFVTEDMPSWNPNLKSKTAIRTADTRYFSDPSMATASLGIGPNDLINDLKTFGLIFETLCVRDLRIYAEAIDGTVYHYRDKTGLECDAVIHLRNGAYGLVEIKLGGDNAIDHATATLTKLAERIDRQKMGQPAFMMILTAVGSYAYRRADGIWIVPICCLKD
ncbi:MAG: DUF4143 domain-containing protein [Duncaniella sp.]|nr:DUF4143 domain-containing protein [Duncaniella sp.]MDE6581502.1 DUF4143 domain-containing protein [Duncaniella sp.]